MREYFKQLLQNFHVLTGYRQMENMTHAEASNLLDQLEKACNRFGKLPDKRKKWFIDKAILEDADLKKLTPAKVTQWLTAGWESLDAATKYNYLNAGKPEEKHEPLLGDAAQPYIDQWRKTLAQVDYSALEPLTAEVRIMKSPPPKEGARVALKEIPCKGYFDGKTPGRKPCIAPEYCPGCKGLGRIKVTC